MMLRCGYPCDANQASPLPKNMARRPGEIYFSPNNNNDDNAKQRTGTSVSST
jgi:hypothetical protein